MIYEDLKHLMIADFSSIINNYYITFGSIKLLNDPDSPNKLTGQSYLNIDLSPLAFNLKDKTGLEILSECFLKSGFRTAIRESFEVIFEYCKKTNQLEILKKCEWFHFLRLIRNGTAHNFNFKFVKSDYKLLPITWKNKIISKNMDETAITLYFFNYKDCWDLLKELEVFIERLK